MAFTFLKLFGKKREEEALALTGFLVSIPIFCDSGFVVLSPIAKAISKATKKSVIGLGVALAAGLVITHSLVPPTPGPDVYKRQVSLIRKKNYGKIISEIFDLLVYHSMICGTKERKHWGESDYGSEKGAACAGV